MEGYLGEFEIDLSKTKYWLWNKSDWAVFWSEMYGQIDGSHHKAWAIDQIVQILKGTKVIITEARWGNGHKEYRFVLEDTPSKEYKKFIDEYEDGGRYEWDKGINP